MAYYRVIVRRCCNAPKTLIVKVKVDKIQNVICAAVEQLRDEGITDARAIEVVGQVQGLRG